MGVHACIHMRNVWPHKKLALTRFRMWMQACSLCEENLEALRTQYGVHNLKWLLMDEAIGDDVKRNIHILVDLLKD